MPSTTRPQDGSVLSSTPSPENTPAGTPSSSFSSDKENHQSPSAHLSSSEKRKQPRSTQEMELSGNKRRKVSGNDSRAPPQSQVAHQNRLQEENDKDFYDPDQDPEERRAVRKGLRDLTSLLNDSRSEFIQTESSGIRDTIDKANELFRNVKQTSDATIDSQLLVSVADLSYKRTAHAVLGDSGTSSIDLDEFVSKCISFMRAEPVDDTPSSQLYSSSQRRRGGRSSGRSQAAPDDSDDEDDVLNWDRLGRQACFPHNLRPSLPGFLLGPLSVQKRTRQATKRRVQERIDPSRAVQPQELKQTDLGDQETSNLTVICTDIRQILCETQKDCEQRATAELSQMDDVQEDEAVEVMNKHGISDDGGISLFRFCINPRSFGQTVENLFYVSFLIRDGSLGLGMDGNELPTLHPAEAAMPSDAKRKGLQRRQAVFSLDFETWEDLIQTFDIKQSLIPHRDDKETQQGNRSWHS